MSSYLFHIIISANSVHKKEGKRTNAPLRNIVKKTITKTTHAALDWQPLFSVIFLLAELHVQPGHTASQILPYKIRTNLSQVCYTVGSAVIR